MNARGRKGSEETRAIREKAARMERARRERNSLRHLLHVGALGWILIVPAILGAILGRLLGEGQLWASVVGLLVGIFFGALAVAWNVKRALAENDEEGKG